MPRRASHGKMEDSAIIEPIPDDELDDDLLGAGSADGDDDGDMSSDYEPSLTETTFGSITSSVEDHVWEYGRRYHVFRYGRYPIPNDEEEYKRESLRHAMLKELLGGKLYFAPIGDRPQKIIDLGTGFGDWAVEVGETLPSARVIGVDLSPIQPLWIPPNVEFMVDDIEDEWVQDSDFDFAHLRIVNTVLRDSEGVFDKVFQNLKPGGWVEAQDILARPGSDDGTVQPSYPPCRFYDLVWAVLKDRYGFDIRVMEHVPDMLRRIGYVNIQKKVFHLPLGEWPQDKHLRTMGGYFREVFLDFVDAMAARPLVEAGFEKDEIDELVAEIRKVLEDRRVHGYLPVHFVWAQKPL